MKDYSNSIIENLKKAQKEWLANYKPVMADLEAAKRKAAEQAAKRAAIVSTRDAIVAGKAPVTGDTEILRTAQYLATHLDIVMDEEKGMSKRLCETAWFFDNIGCKLDKNYNDNGDLIYDEKYEIIRLVKETYGSRFVGDSASLITAWNNLHASDGMRFDAEIEETYKIKHSFDVATGKPIDVYGTRKVKIEAAIDFKLDRAREEFAPYRAICVVDSMKDQTALMRNLTHDSIVVVRPEYKTKTVIDGKDTWVRKYQVLSVDEYEALKWDTEASRWAERNPFGLSDEQLTEYKSYDYAHGITDTPQMWDALMSVSETDNYAAFERLCDSNYGYEITHTERDFLAEARDRNCPGYPDPPVYGRVAVEIPYWEKRTIRQAVSPHVYVCDETKWVPNRYLYNKEDVKPLPKYTEAECHLKALSSLGKNVVKPYKYPNQDYVTSHKGQGTKIMRRGTRTRYDRAYVLQTIRRIDAIKVYLAAVEILFASDTETAEAYVMSRITNPTLLKGMLESLEQANSSTMEHAIETFRPLDPVTCPCCGQVYTNTLMACPMCYTENDTTYTSDTNPDWLATSGGWDAVDDRLSPEPVRLSAFTAKQCKALLNADPDRLNDPELARLLAKIQEQLRKQR